MIRDLDRCPRLLNYTTTPGAAHSPDGPRGLLSLQCVLHRGHKPDGHIFRIPKAKVA